MISEKYDLIIKRNKMQIEITDQTAEALKKLNNRYFFDLFKPVRTSEEEEYQFRDAIEAIVKELNK